jgi:TPR repeat protein
MYTKGQGVLQDYAEAVKWYRLAAAQGNSTAQLNLGVMYDNGYGVLQDFAKAHAFYNLAATKGNPNAVKNRDIVAKSMTAQQIADAQKLARDCLARNFKGCD